MSKFKLSWRLTSLYFDDDKWESFLRLIDKYDNVADEVAFYVVDDKFPHLDPLSDKRKQTEICKERFKDLRERGCSVGINVWPSLNLYPIEQKNYSDMPRMIDIDGKSIQGVACPVSPQFLDFISQKYTIYAKAEPDFIWMDDDCRFTHMGGRYPCFCDNCVKGFKNGVFKSREELAEELSKPENRDLRIAWSSYGAERLATLCKTVRAAVDKVNPNIDIGLMTVGATHSTFSGDYIDKCMTALRSKRGRPGHDVYSDAEPNKIMWKTLEVGRQVLEYPETTTEILWEEDSHPQGHLRKSFHTRQNEVSLALMAGCSGVAFNHAAMNGFLDERLGREVDELHALRPRWEKFFEFSKGLDWAGMWPLHSWFMTAKANPEYAWLKENPWGTNKGYQCDITIPEQIGPCGIALTTDSKNACATLLSRKTLTVLDKEELKKVFSGNVYMDASALQGLEELGLEHLAGVKIEPNRLPNKPCVMTDHGFNGEFAGHNYRGNHSITAHTLIPLDDKVEWLGYRADVLGEGDRGCISKYENSLGGKVIVNAYDAWEFVDSPNNIYQFASIAKWFGSPIVLRYKNPHVISRVQPYIRTNGQRAAVMVLNASFDTTNPFEIMVKGDMNNAVLVNTDGSEKELQCHREDDRLCVDIPTINMWDIAFILLT